MPSIDSPRRRSLRLVGWDYRSPGSYGITLVAQHREWVFGEVIEGNMVPNPAGAMVNAVWHEMPLEFPRIELDVFVVMPNHMHAIIWLSDKGPAGNPSLGEVVQRFKSITTARYSDGVHERGWQPYDRRLWWREYYDQIIRNREQLDHARGYIEVNPARWMVDPDRNPERPDEDLRPKTPPR